MQQSITLALLTIAAIIIGPIVALWLQRKSEERRNSRHRKLVIFKELMATRARATRTSPRHVEALNAIEIEFSEDGKGNKKVLNAWRLYLQHFSDVDLMMKENSLWDEKGNQLLTDLLYEMSLALKYDFDKRALQQNVYSPQAYIDFETDQFLLRKFFLEVLIGKRPIRIIAGEDPPIDDTNKGT